MPPKLGILAGGGALPGRLIDHCRKAGRAFFVVAFEGHCEPATVAQTPHIWSRMGAAGTILSALRRAEVGEIVLAGRVRRPSFGEIRPDIQGLRILTRVATGFLGGDDKLLRAVAGALEREGFRVVGAHDILTDLLAPKGPLGRHRPDAEAELDIAVGVAAARDLGRRDLGQAVVVRRGTIVGEEDVAGTDALIRRAAGKGGVLVKMKKPQQDDRLDLPAIGPDTVRLAADSGFIGIVVEAEHTLLVDREEAVRTADATGLFLVGADGG
jgi:DUF1009 family protein